MRGVVVAFSFLFIAGFNVILAQGGDDPQTKKMQEAEILTEAGLYARAREIYRTLFSQQKEEWKKEILSYDIATTHLEEGNWEEAIRAYEAIPLGDHPFPLLARRLRTNWAIAQWHLAQELISQMKGSSDHLSQHDADEASYLELRSVYLKIIILLRGALKNIDEAEKAHCQVQVLEGRTSCDPAYDLKNLRAAVEEQYSDVLAEYTKMREELSPLKEGIPMLLTGVNSINAALGELVGVPMSLSIKQQQFNRMVHQAKTWLPLITSQHEKVAALQQPSKERLFSRAEKAFLEGLDGLKEEVASKASESFKVAESALNELFFAILEEDPIQEVIQKLLVSYERALGASPLQEGALQSIDDQQSIIEELLKRKELPLDQFAKARLSLRKSIRSAHKGEDTLARIYLQTSNQEIQRLGWSLVKNNATPEKIIEASIAEQLYTMVVSQLVTTVDPPSKEMKEIIDQGQESTVKQASIFWEVVLEEQQRVFSRGNEGKGIACQYQPWSQVVPLFNEGYEQAKYAMKTLGDNADIGKAFFYQQRAVRAWKDALEKLKTTPPQESCGESGGEQEPESEEEQEQQKLQQPQSKRPSIDEVLRLLQQMEQDDRQEKRPGIKIDTGEKQW